MADLIIQCVNKRYNIHNFKSVSLTNCFINLTMENGDIIKFPWYNVIYYKYVENPTDHVILVPNNKV